MTEPPSTHLWTSIDARLRERFRPTTYDRWIAPLRLREVDGDTIVVVVPPDADDHMRRRITAELRRAAKFVLGPDATAVLVDDDAHAHTAEASDGPRTADDAALNPRYAFDQFVIGESNRLAHAAALAVAENPGQAYNPLFIYGPPGVGKSHLLHAIRAFITAFGGGLTVRYTSVEQFTNAFLEALARGDMAAFKRRFRHVDVLLIDDIQFLEAKARTEEEFFHTFNALHDVGSQIVVTSDRRPHDLDALHDRLRERFEAGLVTDITEPDLDVRLAVLRKRARHDDVSLDDEDGVLDAIAGRITANIRALEGALVRVVAYASLSGRPADAALAGEVLDRLYPPSPDGQAPVRGHRVTVAQVQATVARQFALTVDELLSADRSIRVVWPRHLAMYLAREHTGATLPALGAAFGGRNHTTVLNACRRLEKRIVDDAEARETVRALTDRLQHPGVDREA